MHEISVKVVEFGDRKHYQMQFVDPLTRKKKTRSTGVERTGLKRDRVEAERVAAKWEAELREGRYSDPGKTTWSDFRERYEAEHLSGRADATVSKVDTVFDMVEKMLAPAKVRDVTAQRLSWLAAELRKDKTEGDVTKHGLSEATIRAYLAHLKAALRWAESVGLIVKAPAFPKPQRTGGDPAKGRAITGEEFDRLIEATLKVVGNKYAAEWQRYLRGLWLSGFRIGESLDLSWDEGRGIVVDITGRNPVAHMRRRRRNQSGPSRSRSLRSSASCLQKHPPTAERASCSTR